MIFILISISMTVLVAAGYGEYIAVADSTEKSMLYWNVPSNMHNENATISIINPVVITQSTQVFVNGSLLLDPNVTSITLPLFNENITISKTDDFVFDEDLGFYYGKIGDPGDYGQSAFAVSPYNGTLYGSIHVKDRHYRLMPSSVPPIYILYETDIPTSLALYEHHHYSHVHGTVDTNIPNSTRSYFERLASVYEGGHDYTENAITVDVYVGYTEESVDLKNNLFDFRPSPADLRTQILEQIANTNTAFKYNKLPLRVHLVEFEQVNHTQQGTIVGDWTLLDDNPNLPIHVRASDADADITILIVNYDKGDFRGYANVLALTATDAIIVLENDRFTQNNAVAHEIGHIFGARHQSLQDDVGRPPVFGYEQAYSFMPTGHTSVFTVTGIPAQICLFEDLFNLCVRHLVWSDPYATFPKSTRIAADIPRIDGESVKERSTTWNAKVLFATGPYIASLRGGTEPYSEPPQGTIKITKQTRDSGPYAVINASFGVSIHPDFPPQIEIIEGLEGGDKLEPVVVNMTALSDGTFVAEYKMSDANQNLIVKFVGGADMYGTEIAADPKSILLQTVDIEHPTAPSTLSAVVQSDKTIKLSWVGMDNATFEVEKSGVDVVSYSDNNVTVTAESYIHIDSTTDMFYVDTQVSSDGIYTYRVRTTMHGLHSEYAYTGNITLIPPTITTPDITVEATGKHTPVDIGWVSIADDIDANPIISYTPESLPLGNHTVSWTATDQNNNTATVNQHIAVQDTTPPDITVTDVYVTTGVIGLAANDTAGMNASLVEVDPLSLFVWRGFVDFENAVAEDTVDEDVELTHNAPPFFTAVTVITWTATDDSGNMASANQTVTIVDSVGDVTPPIILAPNKTVEATAPQTPVNASWITVSDDKDERVTISHIPESLPLGNHTVSWTAIDHNNNTATVTQHITVQDTAPPTIHTTDITMSATGEYTAIDIWSGISATDMVDISPTLKHDAKIQISYNEGDPTPIEQTVFPIGVTVVNWNATDASGNVGWATQTVTVLNGSDTMPPVISAPSRTIEATGPQTPVDMSWITVSDDTDANPTISYTPESLPLGRHIVSWTATDISGNSATANQTVTIQDTIPPSVTAPSDIVYETSDTRVFIEMGWAAATDTVDEDPAIRWSIQTGSLSGPNGTDVQGRIPVAFFVNTNNTIVWEGVDDSGNVGTDTQTVIVRSIKSDTTPPTISAPADITKEATGQYTPVSLRTANATDDSDPSPRITNNAPDAFPVGTTAVLWTATDNDGNTATDTQYVTIQDTIPPTVTPPSNIRVETNASYASVEFGWATAADVADPAPTISYTKDPATQASDIFNAGVTKVIWTATDSSGNAGTAIQFVSVLPPDSDDTPPTITPPPDITAEATSEYTTVDIGVATSNDESATISNNAPSLFPLGTTIVMWTATDELGNAASANQTVTIQDTTPPNVISPPDITHYTTLPYYFVYIEIGLATATDAVDEDPAIHLRTQTGSLSGTNGTDVQGLIEFQFEVGKNTTLTWVATDKSGNVGTDTQIVIVQRAASDITPPVISAPADITKEATGQYTPVSLGNATATDDVDIAPTITNNAPSSFPLGITIVTWNATDSSGNSATDTQHVTVQDTTPPTITVPPYVQKEATGYTTYVDYGTATATDLVDPSPKVYRTLVTAESDGTSGLDEPPLDSNSTEVTGQDGYDFLVGTHRVYWSATDDSGNSASGGVQIIVVTDTTPPVISAPADITVSATGEYTSVSLGNATATDLADQLPRITNNAPSAFPLGVTIVTWTATDASGNSATDTQRVTVTAADTIYPTITAPDDITKEATGEYTFVSPGNATVTDNIDVSPTVTNNAPSTFPLGTTTVTWTATDDAGNSASDTQLITVQDTTPPTLTIPPDMVVQSTGDSTWINGGTGTAIDLVDPNPTIHTSYATASGQSDEETSHTLILNVGVGTYLVTWTAEDFRNNRASAVQNITVAELIPDTTPPVITAPTDITKEATGEYTSVSLGNATVTDNIDVSPTVTNNAPSTFTLGTTTVTWTATDASGNTATDTQRVTIQDTTPPTVTVSPTVISKEATGYRTYVDFGRATATDLVDSYPRMSYSITFGNTAGMSFDSSDTISDVIEALEGAPTETLDSTEVEGQYDYDFRVGLHTIYWTAMDESGNVGREKQYVWIQDTTPPTLSATPNIVKEATGKTTFVYFSTPTATDLVDSSPDITYTMFSVSGSEGFAEGSDISLDDLTEIIPEASGTDEATGSPWAYLEVGRYAVIWTATDNYGNSASQGQWVDVEDTTPPNLSVPSNIIKEATGYRTYVDFGRATATDLVDSSPRISYSITFGNTAGMSFDSSDTISDVIEALEGMPTEILDSTEVEGQDGYYFRVGFHAINWKATDDYGNVDTERQYVWVRDTTPPTIAQKSDIYRDTYYYRGVVVTYTNPTATDRVDSYVPVSCSPASGSTFYAIPTTVTCTGTDDSGNTGTSTFRVIVTNVWGESGQTNSTIHITGEVVYDDSIKISWDEYDDGTVDQYKAVIFKDRSDKFTDYTADTEYQFVNLEPDTEYTIRIGVKGYDNTIAELNISTTGMPFDTGISLTGVLVPNSDQILLKWSDGNDIGNNNYRVERNTGDGYEDTILRPKSNTTIQDTIKPDWLGQTISYIVYERLGTQKLFSNDYDITIPSKLEAPRNLVATTQYEEGIGPVIVLSWEDPPLFRNYIIEESSDGTWSRIEKTYHNMISLYITAGEHQFRVMSHINGVTSAPAEITVQYSSEGGN